MIIESTNVELTTEDQLLPNTCYKQPFYFLKYFFENVCIFKIKV